MEFHGGRRRRAPREELPEHPRHGTAVGGRGCFMCRTVNLLLKKNHRYRFGYTSSDVKKRKVMTQLGTFSPCVSRPRHTPLEQKAGPAPCCFPRPEELRSGRLIRRYLCGHTRRVGWSTAASKAAPAGRKYPPAPSRTRRTETWGFYSNFISPG